MLTKYTDEKYIAMGAPRSGKTWEMLCRSHAANGVIIVGSEERRRWLEEMANHIGLPKPNVVVWKQGRKQPVKNNFCFIAIDDYPAFRFSRGCGKPNRRALLVLDEMETRLLKQNPYPYGDISCVRELRAFIEGEW